MRVYVDSSVILRLVLGEPDPLPGLDQMEGVTSALSEVECLRVLDRLRLRGALPESELLTRRAAVFDLLDRLETVELTRSVLSRAAQPLPAPLRTLDALHLSTALLIAELDEGPVRFATHDAALARTATACGLEATGV